jgi:hypothetical protein
MKKLTKKQMSPFRDFANLMPAIGYMAGITLALNALKDIFNVKIIKRFRLGWRYELWIIRRPAK